MNEQTFTGKIMALYQEHRFNNLEVCDTTKIPDYFDTPATSKTASGIEDVINIMLGQNIENPDKITISWSIDDVLHCAKDAEIECSEDQAREVLGMLVSEHDANTGINWDFIRGCIEEVCQ